jgi:arylsulfatase
MDRRTFLSLAGAGACGFAAESPQRPNLLLIVADDLGYSDLGCFGGEIETPNLDRLAKGGVRFTQFYNTARCCPSRASLMTGLYPHQAGIGNMDSRMGDLEGYQGHLNESCATIPEVLKPAGYQALMSGKWHLGKPTGPITRGFEDYYGLVHGFDSFWDESKYRRLPEGRPSRTYGPGKFYATDAITDHALDFLAAARKQKKPYFLYLAYNAPHFPLHAPKDAIDKYVPVYEKGWDYIREKRFERMREMGIVNAECEFSPRSIIGPNRVTLLNGRANEQNPAWDTIDVNRRKDLARRMAVYAAMVDTMDRNIGRIIEDLRGNGELDNTLIVFLSDNGACAEWLPWGFDGKSGPDNVLHTGAELDRMGQPGTYHSYGSAWANTSNTPLRMYKHYNHEGGISTPFIAHWPSVIRRTGAVEHQPAHLTDIMATFVEVSGAAYPRSVQPMEGRSLVPAFAGKRIERGSICWEHEGNRAIRSGPWKLVAMRPDGEWELYNIDDDRTEMHNLAAKQPARVKQMAAEWEQWARRTKVLPWPWKPQYGEDQAVTASPNRPL